MSQSTGTQVAQPQATESQIAMWRGAIALAWADGKLDESEKSQLLDFFKENMYLSDAQRSLLIRDLDSPVQLKDVWGGITDRQDRAHLIDIAPNIFWQDGSYSPDEHDIYDKMFADQMSTVDMQQVKADVEKITARIPAEVAQDEKEYEEELRRDGGRIIGTAALLIYRFEKMLGLE